LRLLTAGGVDWPLLPPIRVLDVRVACRGALLLPGCGCIAPKASFGLR